MGAKMRRKIFVLLVMLPLLSLGSSANQIDTPCDESIWKHIHSPERFYIANRCVVIRGTVKTVGRNFYDGDAVYGVLPDRETTEALRKIDPKMDDHRIKKQGGLLRLEIVCAYPRAKWWGCHGYKNALPLPMVGDLIEASGPYVKDGHGRIELHGPTDVKILRSKTTTTTPPR